jgi:carbamoyl-phosphate synthase small subunit
MAGQELASRVTSAQKYDWIKGSIDLTPPAAAAAISLGGRGFGAFAQDSKQIGLFAGSARNRADQRVSSSGHDTGCAVSTPQPRGVSSRENCTRYRVVAYDFGIKQNILRLLVDHGCDVTVVPARTPAEDVLSLKPRGVFLSNGPGDPEPITYAIANIRKLVGRVPIFGICLGHQLCGLALGGRTFKLKFGHHGSNHPVKNLLTQEVEITAQNHGFCVDPDSLPSSEVEITHVNLNDHTNEGMRHRLLPLFSVQYHPEASPGPHDARYLFDQFVTLMSSEGTF